MFEKKYYAGIDYFRMIAALLVVTIHTRPLESFGKTADFMLSGIAARVAVPFFFMASGFFLLFGCAGHTGDSGKLFRFVKKTAIVYAAATLLYLPVNIYRGYFSAENIVSKVMQDIVFDGTWYHLWYLPASVAGAAIAWVLVRKAGLKASLAITGILYVIGVFGDSYLGIVRQVPVLSDFYRLTFQVCDYTRNGIFFAPVFLALGGYLADRKRILSVKKSLCGFLITFGLLFAEAVLLRPFEAEHHDSMYFFLLPCMYFLFSLILHWKGKCPVWFKTVSLIVYIIHPMMIILLRPAAKLLALQQPLLENSLIHYAAVCLLSLFVSVLCILRGGKKH